MKTLLAIALTILCWGIYGPVLHWGQKGMFLGEAGLARLRPFICVGLAYFLIAVLAPGIWLYLRGETGKWTVTGAVWSLIAGAAGALGALGIILAFWFKGNPMYVMPLVFGGAPVVNSFLTIYMSKTLKQVGPVFLAGLILVIAGAAAVLIFKPVAAHPTGPSGAEAEVTNMVALILSILLVVVSWGAYGPVLHKGQMKMQGSRLRPLMCVGLAYFAIAVLVPTLWLTGFFDENSGWTFDGTVWSLAAGGAGAIGALGIIMAFASGGKPVYVMPLVFGGAPVVNTLFNMITQGAGSPSAPFYAGLFMVAAGAVTVLIFAPKGGHPAK